MLDFIRIRWWSEMFEMKIYTSQRTSKQPGYKFRVRLTLIQSQIIGFGKLTTRADCKIILLNYCWGNKNRVCWYATVIIIRTWQASSLIDRCCKRSSKTFCWICWVGAFIAYWAFTRIYLSLAFKRILWAHSLIRQNPHPIPHTHPNLIPNPTPNPRYFFGWNWYYVSIILETLLRIFGTVISFWTLIANYSIYIWVKSSWWTWFRISWIRALVTNCAFSWLYFWYFWAICSRLAIITFNRF